MMNNSFQSCSEIFRTEDPSASPQTHIRTTEQMEENQWRDINVKDTSLNVIGRIISDVIWGHQVLWVFLSVWCRFCYSAIERAARLVGS